MDNQFQQKIDPSKSENRESRLSKDSIRGVSNIPQTANLDGVQTRFSPWRFLIITIGGIFLAEIVAMIVLTKFSTLPYYLQTLLDASIMVIMIFPLVYYLSLQPLLIHIEKRRQTEDELRKSEERFIKAFHFSPAALSITRVVDGGFIDVNESFLQIHGSKREEVVGHTLIELGMFTNPDERDELKQQTLKQRLFAQEGVRDYEMETHVRSGEIRTVLISTEGIELDSEPCILTSISDITERKRAEIHLRRVNRALSVLKGCNQILVRSENENKLVQQMCDVIVNNGEYQMAWVGFAKQDSTRSILPVAQSGFKNGYLDLAQITWADNERGRGPTGTAIREGVVQVNQNFLTNPKMEPWRASAISRGYQSSIALPLVNEETSFGALTIYSAIPDAFDEDEVQLLTELANDLAFGITALRVRTERNQAQEQIREMALFPALNPDAVLRVDSTGQIKMSNPAANQMGFQIDAQLTEIVPDLRGIDLPGCIAAGAIEHIQQEARLGNNVLLWTVRGIPELGLAFLYGKDITGRKRAEAAIHQLSSVIEQTEDTVVITNRSGMIEYVNPAFERLTGFTREEAVGKTPKLLKSGMHDDQFYQTLWETILNGGVFQAEIANRKKNGELLYEVKTISPLRDSQDEITHFVATGKDITEHKRDEEKLRKAYDELELRVQERTEELRTAISELEAEINERRMVETQLTTTMLRLEAHIDNSPLAVVEFDPQFRVLRWSHEAERIFGWSAKEVIGHSITELHWVHEEDAEIVTQTSNDMLSGKSPRNLNINRNYCKDGTIIYCEWYNSALYDSQGHLASIQSLVLDVSARKLAEEALSASEARFRLALTNAPVSVATQDRDLRFLWAYNQRTVEPRAVIGKTDTDLFPPEDAARLIALKRQVLETEKELREQLWITSGGKRVFLDLFIEPQRDETGQVIGIGIATVDLTTMKLAEDALRKNEATLRGILDATKESIWLFSPDGIVLMANETALSRLHKSAGEVIGKNFSKFMPTTELAQSRQAYLRKVTETGQPLETEDQRAGIFFRHTYYPVKDADGCVVQIVSFSRDITVSKQAEVTLQESEQRFRLLFETMLQGVVYQDANGDIISMNPASEQILGKTRENFLGSSSVKEEHDTIREDGTPYPGLEHPAMVSLRTGEKVRDAVMGVYNSRMQDYRWISIDSVPIIRPGENKPHQVYTLFSDITERKRAEELLKQSEERYRSLFNGMTEGFALHEIICDEDDLPCDYRFIEINPAFERLTGLKQDHIIGRLVKEVLPDTEPYWIKAYGQVALTGQPAHFENFSAALNRHYEVFAYSPAPRQFAVLFLDISERKHAQETLQRRNEELDAARTLAENERRRLEAMMEALPIGVAITDIRGGTLKVNNAFELIWGEKRPLAHSVNDYGPYQAWWTETGKLVAPNEWASAQVVQKGEPVIGQLMEIQRFDGSHAFVINSASPIRDSEGAVVGSAVAIQDVTDLRKGEQSLRKAHDELELRVRERTAELAVKNSELLNEISERKEVERQLRIQSKAMEAAANGILITDPQGNIQWMNSAITQISGYDAHELLGQSTRIFKSGKQDADFYCQMWNTILSGEVWRGELTNRRKDGSLYAEEQTITPVQDENGLIPHFISIKQDITVRKQAEMELEQRNMKLQALTKAEREQRQLAEALVEAAIILNKSLKLDDVLVHILEQIKGVIPYQLADIMLLEGETFYDASHAGELSWPVNIPGTANRFPLASFPMFKNLIRTGEPALIQDTRKQADWVVINGLEWSLSFLSAPLLVEGDVIGFVNLFAEQTGFFTQEMCDRLVAFAAHAAVAIQNAWLFEQVRASSERLHSLSRRLVEIQENERRYISRELHDEAGQLLTSLMVDLRLLEKKASQPEIVKEKIVEMEGALNQVLENLHRVAMALRPASLDHVGLVSALSQHVESIGEKHSLRVSFKSTKLRKRLPANVETVLYRIVQEAMTNVVRHAHATRVDVVLTERDDKLIVIVEDDGIGFDPDTAMTGNHLGLFGIRERAEMIDGKLVIESAPGKGTTLIVEVSYANTIVSRR